MFYGYYIEPIGQNTWAIFDFDDDIVSEHDLPEEAETQRWKQVGGATKQKRSSELADEIFDVIGSPKIVLPATAERGARLEALCHVAAWLIASSPQDDRQRFGTPSEEGSGKKSPTRVRSNAP